MDDKIPSTRVEFPLKELKRFHAAARKEMDNLGKAASMLEKTKNVASFEKRFVKFFGFCENELPIHIDDEEKALFPIMRTFFPEDGEDAGDTIDDVLNDHKDVFAAIEAIKLMKRVLGGEKSRDPKFIADIVARTRNLISAMDEHFLKEETMIFGAVEYGFTPGQMEQLARKMTKNRECRKKYGDSVKSCKP